MGPLMCTPAPAAWGSAPLTAFTCCTLLPTDRLRLADLAQPRARGAGTDLRATLAPHEELVEFDCADYDGFAAACEGVHTVVHLAADPSPSAEFYESLLPRNILGAYSKLSSRLCASLLLKLLLHRRVRGRGRRHRRHRRQRWVRGDRRNRCSQRTRWNRWSGGLRRGRWNRWSGGDRWFGWKCWKWRRGRSRW